MSTFMQAQADDFSAREVAESMGLANTNLPWFGSCSVWEATATEIFKVRQA